MFFFRMIAKALRRQLGKRVMIAVTIALGAALTTSMMAVLLDIGDKVKQELSSYGANIEVTPKGASVVSETYGTQGPPSGALQEAELPRLKSIFWAYNIEDFAPYLGTEANPVGEVEPAPITLYGTWFDQTMQLEIGEPVQTGLQRLRSWWDVDGAWASDEDPGQAMVGVTLAESQGWSVGDTLEIAGVEAATTLRIVGIFHAGGEEDGVVYVPLATAQALTGRPGEIDRIEVRAITTPENELSQRAERDPSSLSVADWETWYCTAYVSSISYQIEEALTDAVAKPVRQVADSEGAILEQTQLIMALIAVLAMVGSALGIANLVTASVMERAPEIGLLKAIGARNASIVALILAETLLVGLAGGAVGFALGIGLAQVIGQLVFSSWITLRPLVLPVMVTLVISMILVGSLPSLRALMKLKPSDVLHGK